MYRDLIWFGESICRIEFKRWLGVIQVLGEMRAQETTWIVGEISPILITKELGSNCK